MKISESMGGGAQRAYSWNTVLEFESNTAKSFSDQKLAGIAQEAKRQMDKDYVNRSPSQYTGIRKPTAVTVLAIGNRMYIASSIKASNYIIDSGHKNFKVALLRTQEELCRIKPHRTNANCGELAASHLFYTLDPESSMAGGVVWWPHSFKAKKIVLF